MSPPSLLEQTHDPMQNAPLPPPLPNDYNEYLSGTRQARGCGAKKLDFATFSVTLDQPKELCIAPTSCLNPFPPTPITPNTSSFSNPWHNTLLPPLDISNGFISTTSCSSSCASLSWDESLELGHDIPNGSAIFEPGDYSCTTAVSAPLPSPLWDSSG